MRNPAGALRFPHGPPGGLRPAAPAAQAPVPGNAGGSRAEGERHRTGVRPTGGLGLCAPGDGPGRHLVDPELLRRPGFLRHPRPGRRRPAAAAGSRHGPGPPDQCVHLAGRLPFLQARYGSGRRLVRRHRQGAGDACSGLPPAEGAGPDDGRFLEAFLRIGPGSPCHGGFRPPDVLYRIEGPEYPVLCRHSHVPEDLLLEEEAGEGQSRRRTCTPA